MGRRHISDDVKEMALSMSFQGLSHTKIRELTGVSERSIKRLRSTHRDIGTVSAQPIAPGRPRLLTSMEVKVCFPFLDM
jgi:transposase